MGADEATQWAERVMLTSIAKLRTKLTSPFVVYALRNWQGQIVYVGRTANLKRRIARHRSNGIPFVDYVHWRCFEPELASREIELIDQHRPRFNRRRG